MKYKVVEIFDSIDGEGKRTGQPVSFVRLAGCNLRCSYCDTAYALFGEEELCEYREMSAEEILNSLNKAYKRVTLTGGEPLIAAGAAELIRAMAEQGYEVNIETNGACDTEPFSKIDNVFFTIDYKLKSSGMSDKMLWKNYLELREHDVIKFVVGSDEDAEQMIEIMGRLKKHYKTMPSVFAGAVFGKYDLGRLGEKVMKTPELADVRIQLQLHKHIGVR